MPTVLDDIEEMNQVLKSIYTPERLDHLLNAMFIPDDQSERLAAILDHNGIELTQPTVKKCECGAHSVGVDKHADWCALYTTESEWDGTHEWATYNQARGCYSCIHCKYEAFPDKNGKFHSVPICPGA